MFYFGEINSTAVKYLNYVMAAGKIITRMKITRAWFWHNMVKNVDIRGRTPGNYYSEEAEFTLAAFQHMEIRDMRFLQPLYRSFMPYSGTKNDMIFMEPYSFSKKTRINRIRIYKTWFGLNINDICIDTDYFIEKAGEEVSLCLFERIL